jgi:hypothetical protein
MKTTKNEDEQTLLLHFMDLSDWPVNAQMSLIYYSLHENKNTSQY